MLEPHLPEIDINNLQLEISRKQTLNLSIASIDFMSHGAIIGYKIIFMCNAVVYCQLEVVFKLSQLNP